MLAIWFLVELRNPRKMVSAAIVPKGRSRVVTLTAAVFAVVVRYQVAQPGETGSLRNESDDREVANGCDQHRVSRFP